MGRGLGVSLPLQVPPSPHLLMFTGLEAPWTPSVRNFMEPSALLCGVREEDRFGGGVVLKVPTF